jgi:site-specific DNA-cytosine methylase
MERFPLISLLAGAGGLDMGFEQEGFAPVLAFDMDAACVDTYN